MTSFGTSLCMLDSTVFMPTFRIRGQVYHKPESLMSLPNEDAQFLQKYFLGNEEAEAKRRYAITNDSDPANHGKFVILPSTFTGCPRNMHEYAQDAITYLHHGGTPSLFITYKLQRDGTKCD
ncbi:hypothetical protein AVEN_43302-1 [Araneus ventricosus]|uniref:Helitron helicase-like domain-containing protein n=1 Tax=Araneus ventricosus TaxID=182803 RepID=A0A4Y2N672_ARAVE|nr:hypothetical protein AVEN_43302-1 [Araneus ventricosus]